jgi:HEAT repeat protein
VTICLGDLGTLSAIPLLRSYIEDHHETIDRSLYLEIISAIKRLGGSTEDLPRPFGQDLDLDDRLKFLFGLGGGA